MNKLYVPCGYEPVLGNYETQTGIGMLKRIFEKKLCAALKLKRVSAPLFVDPATGLNDDLSGVERPVTFDIPGLGGNAQVVHSLAKWKRQALFDYNFPVGEGLYTDMNAIRRDEDLDNLHSIYVDQWDWEKIIRREDRSVEYLQNTVRAIMDALCDTQVELKWMFPQLRTTLCRDVLFITSQELEDRYPGLSSKERENELLRTCKSAFLMQIGAPLRSGKPHDGRAPDYDDWSLNGDLLIWSDLLDCAVEISSMGIRVDAEAMDRQLTFAGCDNRRSFPFHQKILDNTLPLTIGGGIGQSRVSLLLLEKAHIGEVQVSLWDEETRKGCAESGIKLL